MEFKEDPRLLNRALRFATNGGRWWERKKQLASKNTQIDFKKTKKNLRIINEESERKGRIGRKKKSDELT